MVSVTVLVMVIGDGFGDGIDISGGDGIDVDVGDAVP